MACHASASAGAVSSKCIINAVPFPRAAVGFQVGSNAPYHYYTASLMQARSYVYVLDTSSRD